MKLHVASSVAEAVFYELKGATTVIIDVLRATSVITSAFENGVKAIHPTVEVEDAQTLAETILLNAPDDKVLLAGERSALKIPGFDFGNSPLEFTKEKVSGTQVVMTTTNGTRALKAATGSNQTYIGCLRNVAAVARTIKDCDNVVLICSGTENRVDISDCMAAGAIIHELRQIGINLEIGDLAHMCSCYFDLDTYEERIRMSVHGQRLLGIGLEDDLRYCCQLNVSEIVPRYDGVKITS